MGYDPRKYYSGRGPIEARSMGVELKPGEAAFRCNLVTITEGRMKSYCAGHISDPEAAALIKTLNSTLGSDKVTFYPGVSYRHLVVVKEGEALLKAKCTPPHDIPDKPIIDFMPEGPGNTLLAQLMTRSREILRKHPVNEKRVEKGLEPANSIWLFWGGKKVDDLPPFTSVYKKKAALTSGVDLLRGIARMAGIDVLEIKGVTGGLDNDYDAQAEGAIRALADHDVVIVHVEAPDEAGHMGSIEGKIKAIEAIDQRMIKKFLDYKEHKLRLMVLPDHPTPILLRTHVADPVPFLLHGTDYESNSASAYTEKEAESTGFFVNEGHFLMGKLLF
jgi:2,3-bisphosphoglycerate-independent phosphoglycerate mutase